MPEKVKVLTSRRAFEFQPDDLRLSLLSIKPVQEQIQKLFQFQVALMATPMQTFGEVPPIYPPGLVFDMGVWLSPEQQLIPIRFLHFEQNRIVIDVAGPSTALIGIFEQLQHFLSQLRAPDGTPAVGKPERVLDYSEITAHFPFLLKDFFASPLRKLFSSLTGESDQSKDLVIVPTFVVQSHTGNQILSSAYNPKEPRAFTFALREGTQPAERIYFSGAPLDSEAHLSYLNQLEEVLSS